MMISAYQWLGQYVGHPAFAEILATFSQTAMDVCRGQQMDMDFEQSWNVPVDAYLEMIKLKTAVLLGTALKIGALLGGAESSDADYFYEFGILIGLAFQIQDDILDSFGNPELVGKQVGGDILQNKKTFLLLKTLAQIPDKQSLIVYMESDVTGSEKVEKIKNQMIASGALDAADLLRDDYYEQSLGVLERMGISEADKVFFSELALGMARRAF